jgi:hypothetical protein
MCDAHSKFVFESLQIRVGGRGVDHPLIYQGSQCAELDLLEKTVPVEQLYVWRRGNASPVQR